MGMEKQQFLYWELASKDTIDFKKVYVDMAEDLIGGLLLSQIVYWHLPTKENKESKLRVFRENEYWIAKTRDDWYEEIRITARQFDRAIKILEGKDIVKTKNFKFDGKPVKHIRLNWSHFLAFLEFQLEINGGKSDYEPYSPMDFNEKGKSILTKSENPFYTKGKIHFNKSVKSSYTENTYKEYDIDHLSEKHQGVINLSHKIIGNKLTMDRLKSIISLKDLYEEDLEPVAWKSILMKLKTQLDKRIIKDFDGYLAKIIKQEIENSLTNAPRGQILTKSPVRTEYLPEWYKESPMGSEKPREMSEEEKLAAKEKIQEMLKEIDE